MDDILEVMDGWPLEVIDGTDLVVGHVVVALLEWLSDIQGTVSGVERRSVEWLTPGQWKRHLVLFWDLPRLLPIFFHSIIICILITKQNKLYQKNKQFISFVNIVTEKDNHYLWYVQRTVGYIPMLHSCIQASFWKKTWKIHSQSFFYSIIIWILKTKRTMCSIPPPQVCLFLILTQHESTFCSWIKLFH